MRRLFIVEPDSSTRKALKKTGLREGWDVNSVSGGFDALDWLAVHKTEIVLMSMNLPLINPLKVLEKMKRLCKHTPIILMAESNNNLDITKAFQGGAFDVVFKPLIQELLSDCLEDALSFVELVPSLSKAELLHPFLQGYGDLDGTSKASQNLYIKIDRILDSDISIMINGESGTGKEVAARTIHRFGKLKDQPFVSVNCAAIPENLQESELFGYEKGAFTGAVAQKTGKFETANNGTLFLDEIGDMSLPLQAKILRFIETGELERVGGIVRKDVRVRLITATNKNLLEEVRAKRFREDLFHRLNVYPITLPSLRERRKDIPLLSSLTLMNMIGNSDKNIIIPPDTYDYLSQNNWPGNVRELINSLNRAIVSTKDGVLYPESFSLSESVELEVQNEISLEKEINTMTIPTLKKVEMDAILNALKITDGNIRQASKALGITRATMYNKLKRYNIKVRREIRVVNSQEI
ncbi:MAG: sigma-54-dependent Fis family transcriptional regulator [Candidatus Marinimicrobia bacterium]|nr:sigma-54-dependent Fis family transcriptional regulator [Candidatus Neomarinimicrobiota bacterium]